MKKKGLKFKIIKKAFVIFVSSLNQIIVLISKQKLSSFFNLQKKDLKKVEEQRKKN